MKANMRKTVLRSAIVCTALAAVLIPWAANAQGGFRVGDAPQGDPDAAGAKTRAEKAAPAKAANLANVWCSACHGPGGKGGHGLNPLFPILAGQSAEYLETQLKSFRALSQDDVAVSRESYVQRWLKNITGIRKGEPSIDGYVLWLFDTKGERYDDAPRNEERAWDFMKGVARDLDDPTIKALAEYFAKVPGVPGRAAEGDVARGKALFEQGDAAKGLLPCASCHGADARGNGPIPRLAGQYADYVFDQVKFIKSGTRSVEQMAPLVQGLTDDDIKAVSAYVQTLN
jgi:cytochrome c553